MVDSDSHVFIQFGRLTSTASFQSCATAVGALAIVACAAGCSSGSSGSSTDAPPDSGGSNDGGAPADSGSQADWSVPSVDSSPPPYEAGQPDTGGGDTGGDPDLQCYGQSAELCYQCCVTNHPSGSMTYEGAFYDCMCAPPVGTQGACQTQCAQSDCSSAADGGGSMTGDPCDLCEMAAIGDGGACASPLNTACGASADCLAFSNCQDNCP
jgi:hypothetical protein